MRDCMPEDAHIRCSGKVFVSITVVDPKKGPGALTNLIVSEFTSRDDLMDACMASSCIPYISDDGLGRKFRGQYVVDGGVINNVPHFHDHKRRQIVFRLSQVREKPSYCCGEIFPCVWRFSGMGTWVVEGSDTEIHTTVPPGELPYVCKLYTSRSLR